jgi:Ca2+-binding EF-hand superfamily protein
MSQKSARTLPSIEHTPRTPRLKGSRGPNPHLESALIGMRAMRGDYPVSEVSQKRYVRDFKRHLLARSGSLIRAWRNDIDPEEMWEIGWNSFCDACRRVDYWQGKDLRQLWTALDLDHSGFITVNELDWEGAKRLARFYQVLMRRYGSLRQAWEQALDKHNTGVFHLQALIDLLTLEGMGYRPFTKAECVSLFSALDKEALGYVTMANLQTLERLHLDDIVEAAEAEAVVQKEMNEFAEMVQEVPNFHEVM